MYPVKHHEDLFFFFCIQLLNVTKHTDSVYIQLITSATVLLLTEVSALHLNMEAQMKH